MSLEIEMARIFVDEKECQVTDGTNLLEGCLALGFDLPYFCWHPAMGSVGACRQCAVKQFRDENDKRGRIVMACMTPGAEGIRISINDSEAREFRASVIEGLMINHPHDCPVCDEGGECHLQDMTVMTGHDYRRYRGLKRTFKNQNLGPLVNQEMNRCIQCYRCTRFYNDYAGGHDFGPFVLRNHVFFGRAEEGVLQSEFSGNLVEVCPTGVFTDKPFKEHYTRKWDLTNAPSICVNCSLGCNTIAGERYGGLRRIRNRYNGEVNGYFICDRGRYGYEFVNSDKRVKRPLAIKEGREEHISGEEAVRRVVKILGQGRVIGIGSPRASLETNFALRTLVGVDNFFGGISDAEHRLTELMIELLQAGPARSPSMKEIRMSDAVLVLGEDVTNSAPMVDLSIRQAVRNEPIKNLPGMKIPDWDDKAVRESAQDLRGPLFVAYPNATKLDEVSTLSYHASPDDIARLGFAVAGLIDREAPKPKKLSKDLTAIARQIATALTGAEHPLIISGIDCGNESVIQAAANIALALSKKGKAAQLSFVFPEADSLGLGLLKAKTLGEGLQSVNDGEVATVMIAENDLYRRDDADKINQLFRSDVNVVAFDHLVNSTSRQADILLPAATFAESDGTVVNNEGRAQRYYQVFPAEGDVQPSWKWIREIMIGAGLPPDRAWESYDDIVNDLAGYDAIFDGVLGIAPTADFRIVGQKVARESHRYSGRTSILANINVSEPKPPEDAETPFTFTMEGIQEKCHPALTARYWAPGWNSVQALNKFQEEVAGPLRGGDPGVRLLEHRKYKGWEYFDNPPDKFETKEGKVLVASTYHIFGSEELSMHTRGIAELAPEPYVAINPDDAVEFQLKEGDTVEIQVAKRSVLLKVKLSPSSPRSIVGIPVGLPGFYSGSLAGEFVSIMKQK